MRLSIHAWLDYELAAPADLLIALEVAPMADQKIVSGTLDMTGVEPLVPIAGEESLGRRTWTRGQGRVTACYRAEVEVERPAPDWPSLAADHLRALPPLVVPYLFPSRYCEADKFRALVQRDFGGIQGGAKVEAIAAWIGEEFDYQPGASTVATTAADTFVARAGVCRDFAHLLIAMIRAADIPARMVAAYALGLKPPDFHAVVEVWLAGSWHLIDATALSDPRAIARIGVGRDATDISFLTVFGTAQMIEQRVSVERIA